MRHYSRQIIKIIHTYPSPEPSIEPSKPFDDEFGASRLLLDLLYLCLECTPDIKSKIWSFFARVRRLEYGKYCTSLFIETDIKIEESMRILPTCRFSIANLNLELHFESQFSSKMNNILNIKWSVLKSSKGINKYVHPI